VALLACGAVLARAAGAVTGVDPLLLAVGLGALGANAVGVPARAEAGVGASDRFLAAGVVLLGASVRLDAVAAAGPRVVLVVLAVVVAVVAAVELCARAVLDGGDRLGSLLAAGAGVCGVSAVVAVGSAVDAREDRVAYAAATVLLFDAVTLVGYPLAGEALGLAPATFGVWAGASMFSTGPVVAVGFAHSPVAGEWATLTKLARNALIGVVVLAYATREAGTSGSLRTVVEEFPPFVAGFLVLAVAASVGLVGPAARAASETAYGWLFLLAFVGLGAGISARDLRRVGPAPLALVLVGLLVGSTLSLALLTATG
jgi:uncharacterized integral membrane protein (TIGR00698 family)